MRLGNGVLYLEHPHCQMKVVGMAVSLTRRAAELAPGAILHQRFYTGSRPELKGKLAVIVRSDHPDVVFAQFNYANNGHLNLADPLCYGWHRFPALAFKSKNLRGKR